MGKIILKIIREVRNCEIEEVAKGVSIRTEDLFTYESDCSNMPLSVGVRLCRFYNISLDDLYIGPITRILKSDRAS